MLISISPDKCYRCGCDIKDHQNATRAGRCGKCKTCHSFASYSAEFIRVACRVLRSADRRTSISRLEALIARWTYLSKVDPTLEKGLTLSVKDLQSLFLELRNGGREMRTMRKRIRVES